MTDFDALLKASFAEAHDEPADDGFSVKVGGAVARREAAQKLQSATYAVGMTAAAAAITYGAYAIASAYGQDLLASVGLEIARAHGALSNAPSVTQPVQGVLQSLSAGMAQILLVSAALAGGAVAYRAAQQD